MAAERAQPRAQTFSARALRDAVEGPEPPYPVYNFGGRRVFYEQPKPFYPSNQQIAAGVGYGLWGYGTHDYGD